MGVLTCLSVSIYFTRLLVSALHAYLSSILRKREQQYLLEREKKSKKREKNEMETKKEKGKKNYKKKEKR